MTVIVFWAIENNLVYLREIDLIVTNSNLVGILWSSFYKD